MERVDSSAGVRERKGGLLRRIVIRVLVPLALALVLLLCGVVVFEARSSFLQVRYLSAIAEEVGFEVHPGPSDALRFPQTGPFDERLGYTRVPDFVAALSEGPFYVAAQSRMSPRLLQLMDRGLFPIYREKARAGLVILDSHGEVISDSPYPERYFAEFGEIPALVRSTLLYVEDRELLDERRPQRNPAVNWNRMAKATLDMGLRYLGSDRSVPGASTLATQLEKFRHSPDGITAGPQDKLRQMASASLRAYLDGRETLGAQQTILLDYLNTVPLAAISGHGEVNGVGDGLWAWFGADFDTTMALIAAIDQSTGAVSERQAVAFRQVLSLLLAHRRPTFYLGRSDGHEALHELANGYLELLAREGIISQQLRDAAMGVTAPIRSYAPVQAAPSFMDRKASNSVRTALLARLGMQSLYDLDRLDLVVRSTFVSHVQDSVTALLRRMHDTTFLRANDLRAFRLLERGDPSRVQYAVVVYEKGVEGDLVRVQADNFEGPFSIIGGAKLDLGSTSKLRALVNYLDIVNGLHTELSQKSAAELRAIETGSGDNITRWAIDFLVANPGAALTDMLRGAMERRYSASTAERFFTGGGVHTFVNFDATHNNQVLTVRESFKHSVNLPFIRLMRDITYFYMHRLPGSPVGILGTRDDPRRREYLERFAEEEGRIFLSQFWRKYAGKSADEALEILLEGRALSPTRLAWAYRAVRPAADSAEFGTWVSSHLAEAGLSEAGVRDLYRRTDPSRTSLNDLGYLAGVHPLELWLVAFLADRPDATLSSMLDASREVRREVYQWLYATRRTAAQDQRIRSILEGEAFREIHREWRRLGYPFESLVPSYATALGSSADRPDALGELVGIIVNDGVRRSKVRISGVHFAPDTPFETVMEREADAGERVLSSEVAAVLHEVMLEVVTDGSARRAFGSLRDSTGAPVPIGGKTGTGDHRYRVYGPGGRLLQERVVNRTSTLVFFIGERFYGTITAYVSGEAAGEYGFTSSLPAQLLRMLGPSLQLLVTSVDDSGA